MLNWAVRRPSRVNKLGKYELLGELGRGAMGIVYRARDPIINRFVALKTITTGLANNPDLLQRFYREAQSAGGLQHPNIVTIYDMGEESGTPYMAMQLVEGQTLEQMIQSRAEVPLSLKLSYAMQACGALDYAHKRGIVHRDIKPGNVMLSTEGSIKVLDFGIARVMNASRTQTGMLIGTFAYMSPEQYHGEHADERSDIWSFGVLLYELLAYKRPFAGDAPASLMRSICQQEPTQLLAVIADCPQELDAVLKKMLQKSPNDRYQTMEDVLLDLDPISKNLRGAAVAKLVEQGQEHFARGEFAEARDTLRQALQLESTNSQARNLLEKVNSELKRLLIRPKAKLLVEQGAAFLEEGKIQEARAAAEAALKLDANFEAAHQLHQRVLQEINRFQMVADHLEAAKLRLAERLPEAAEELLAKVFELEPSNKAAKALRLEVLKEKAERQRRLHLLEVMQQARSLWTLQKYEECIHLLTQLEVEFPREEEVLRLLETAREDQAERRRQVLQQARSLLALGRHEACRAALGEIQLQFPNDEEIAQLFDDVLADEQNQQKLQALTEARRLLASRRYDECISLLVELEKKYPAEPEFVKLLEAAEEEKAEQRRQQGLAKAKDLLAQKSYTECGVRLQELSREFPGDSEVAKLADALREKKAEERKTQGLADARNLLASRRYEECLVLLAKLEKEFSRDPEIAALSDAVRAEQAEQQKLRELAEARNLLAHGLYNDAEALLLNLQKTFPEAEDISRLLQAVRKDQAEREKQEKLKEAREHLAARRFAESLALLAKMEQEYSGDGEIATLTDAVRAEQAEQQKIRELTQARNLLANGHYDDAESLLLTLQKDFPEEAEISRFLETVRSDRAEWEKQEILRRAREDFAGRRFAQALATLEPLRTANPNDISVQKLVALIQGEQEKQIKQERLQREWDALKTLADEKNYSEVITRGEKLLVEAPGDDALARLVEFSRTQQKQLERTALLQRTHETIKKLSDEKNLLDAIRVAEEGLKTFLGNKELLQRLAELRREEKKIQTRKAIELRIRTIKKKINREELSDAIDLAKETLDTLGPSSAVNQLLSSAQIEFEAREKKRKQDRKVERIRELVQDGKLDDATQTLNDAVTFDTLDLFDPRVKQLSNEIEIAKTQSAAVVEPKPEPPPPPPLSKEYAWQTGPPQVDTELGQPTVPAAEVALQATASVEMSSAPAVPPELIEPPALTGVDALVPEVPVGVSPQAAEGTPDSPAAGEGGLRSPATPGSVVEKFPPLPRIPVPAGKQNFFLSWKAAAVVALGGLVFGIVLFRHHAVPTNNPERVVHVAPPVAPAQPTVDPRQAQQRQAIDDADKQIAAGDLDGAMKRLQQAASLNGPLDSDIEKKRASVQAAMKDENFRKLQQQEEKLWQSAKTDVGAGHFRSAKENLEKILALPEGGTRREEARNYLVQELPRRQQEESLFAQAQEAARKDDASSLGHAKAVLDQMIQLAGPRKSDAEHLRQTVEEKLATLEKQQQQERVDQQIADLRASARQDLKLGNPASARKKAGQIQQSGGDATSLYSEIQKAEEGQTLQAQYEASYKQALQEYQQASDKKSLEETRNSFQPIAQGDGSHAVDARRYLNDINAKIAALSQPVVPVVKQEIPSTRASDEAAVRDVVRRYGQAFEQKDAGALRQIWPSMGKAYGKLKNTFASVEKITYDVQIQNIEIAPDSQKATVNALVSQVFTVKGNKPQPINDKAVFELSKTNGLWIITDVR